MCREGGGGALVGGKFRAYSAAKAAGYAFRPFILRIRHHAQVLPIPEQFERFVAEVEKGASRFSRSCADLVRFLAFGGFRKGEAANITWADVDREKGEIVVRGDVVTGTKNWSVRRVPMIPDMKRLLQRLSGVRPDAQTGDPVMLYGHLRDHHSVEMAQKVTSAAVEKTT